MEPVSPIATETLKKDIFMAIDTSNNCLFMLNQNVHNLLELITYSK